MFLVPVLIKVMRERGESSISLCCPRGSRALPQSFCKQSGVILCQLVFVLLGFALLQDFIEGYIYIFQFFRYPIVVPPSPLVALRMGHTICRFLMGGYDDQFQITGLQFESCGQPIFHSRLMKFEFRISGSIKFGDLSGGGLCGPSSITIQF